MLGHRGSIMSARIVGDQGVQAHLNQVDAGQRDHHVARQHHSGAQQAVEEVDEGDLPDR